MKKLVKNQFAFLIMLIFVMLYSSININIHAQVLLGSSVNAFTQVGSNRTRVSYAPGINTVLFIHRGDPAIAGSSGNKAMYDISTNGGLSWANNVGSVIDLSSSAPHVRYPQGYIMNPANNTNLTNARIVAAAPKATGVNNSWGRITSGMVTLSATGKKESLVSDSAWIPNSFVERIPGEYWMVSDTNTDGKITLYKGVYSLAGDSVKWTVALKLAKSRMLFDRTIDGNVHYVNPMIAFSPNGQIGWIATNGEIAGGVVDSTLYPIFWSTTNGGQTWTGPQVVRLKNLSNVVASVNSTKPTATIDNDLVVDKNGNPHFAFVVAPKINAYSYNNPTTNKYPIFDITKVNNLWTAVRIDTVSSLNGASFGTLTHGNEIQLSRTKDGSIIFYCWTDTEVANQTTLGKNDYPDLFIKGYNIDATSFGPKISRIHGNHTIFLPNIADIVSDLDSSGYKMHAVITSPTGDENVTVNFSYLDNLYYPRLALINTINQNQSLCYGNQPNRIDGTTKFNINSTYRWIQLNSTSGGFSNAPGVNNLQNYQPGNLYTTTSFRRIVEMGSSADTSNNVIISVSSKTNPKFTVFEPNQCLFNNQFTFVDSTTRIGGGTVNYSWDFGDGSGSNLQNPTKIYNLSGTYVVRLSTYVSQTCKDTFTKTLNVYSKQNTIIDVNDSLQFLGNNSFVFNDNSQIQNGTIVYREWDFGNGTSSLSQNPSKSYSQHGRYKVKLKTTSDKGCVDSNQIFITVLKNTLANFYFQNPIQCLNDNIYYFTDSSIIDSFSTNTYSWNFGDGTFSTSRNPTKRYNTSGLYQVELTVTTNGKVTSSIKKNVTVFPKQSTIIKVTNLTQCLNVNSFDFIDDSRVSSGSITSRIWDFGDGTTSASINPIKKYNSIGNYNVKLKTFTNNGCVDSTIKQVSVIKSPLAGSVAGVNTNVMPNTQYLYNINQQLNHTYEWQIENGAIISGQGTNAINIQWLNNGAGVLRCIITSTNNCTDTAKLQLNVGPTGINDIKISNIKIYPNPTNNIINIEGLNKNENNTIQIFDVQGKLVITKTINEKGTIDFSELNKGVYVIKIGEVVQRIVKM